MSVTVEESADHLLKIFRDLQANSEENSILTLNEQSGVTQYKDSNSSLPSTPYLVSLPKHSRVLELEYYRATAQRRFLQN